jgi:MarR family transcriptional regulator, organic hydroperoxide resistance regulator
MALTTVEFDCLEQEAYLNLWRTYDRLKALEEEVFGRHSLSAQQYNALRLLAAAHPGTLQTLTLSSLLVSRSPDITRLVDRLEQRKLVRRARPPGNRRVVEIRITTAGQGLLADIADEVRKCHVAQLGHLSQEELKSLIHLLKAARRPHEQRPT